MVEYDTLRDFIALVAGREDTKTVERASWDLELACINELIAEARGPLLVFDRFPDLQPGFRVAANLMTTPSRTSVALGLPEIDDRLKLVDLWRKKLRDNAPIPPVEVKRATVDQNVMRGEAVDLLRFPSPRWHPADGGRYISTAGIVIMRDPDEGWVNCAVNRSMLVDRNHVALQIGTGGQNSTIVHKYRARGKPCPVAIALSPDPLLLVAGGFKVPWGQSEYDFAGGLRGRPVEVIPGISSDLPVPAHGEIVLEGVIEPGASCDEGPFGEWTGCIAGKYKKEGGFPHLVTVNSVMYANDPILSTCRPLKPPTAWYAAIPIATAPGIWNQLEGGGQRGIKGVWTHVLESYSAIWTVIAIDQRYKGHAMEVGMAAAVCPASNGWGYATIVTDDDIDITNLEEVLWTVSMRCDLGTDLQIVRGIRSSALFPWISSERRSKGMLLGSRLIFDACKEFERRDDYPTANVFDDDYRRQTATKWSLPRPRQHSRKGSSG